MTDHRQELFDKVSKHLITQGRKAATPHGKCMYRTDEGLSCAIGCLIDDKYYSPDFEGVGLGYPLSAGHKDQRCLKLTDAVQKSLGYTLSREESYLLRSLQAAHDGRTMWKEPVTYMKDLAFRHGLTFNG